MPKIKQFDKPALRKFREDFDKAIAAFAKKNGVAMRLGGASYNESEVTYKLEVCIASDGDMSAKEALGRKSLDLEGAMFGLTEKDYGRTFTNWDGDKYRLVGIKSSRPKYPVSAENIRTGKGYKFGSDVLDKLSKVKK